jgi:hypothetical protein
MSDVRKCASWLIDPRSPLLSLQLNANETGERKLRCRRLDHGEPFVAVPRASLAGLCLVRWGKG